MIMLVVSLVAVLCFFLFIALSGWSAYTFKEEIFAAWQTTKEALFTPFSIGKWFLIALPAWLANFELNNIGNLFFSHFDKFDDFSRKTSFHEVISRCQENILFLTGIGTVLLLVALVIIVLLLWLRARGLFAFMDIIERGLDAEAISVRFKQWKERAASFLKFQIFFSFSYCFVLFFIFFSAAALIVNCSSSSEMTMFFLWLLAFVFFILVLPLNIFWVFYDDFCAPAMRKAPELSAVQAFRVLLRNICRHPGFYLRYLLSLMFINSIFSLCLFLVLVFTCGGCCIGLMLLMTPYLGAVVLLPYLYFRRAFSMQCAENPACQDMH